MEIDTATAWLRQVSGNAQAALDRFAALMQESLPQNTRVVRTGGWFQAKVVSEVEIDFAPVIFTIRIDRGRLHTSTKQQVHNVVLNSRTVDGETWMRQLLDTIGTQTQEARSVSRALTEI